MKARRRGVAPGLLAVVMTAGGLFGSAARGEQASSEFRRLPAGFLDAGAIHNCAILDTAQLRCWGGGATGKLGYGNQDDIGDTETPGSVGPVDVGTGRTVYATAAGDYHTCVILDTGQVRCWGYGLSGRLGYGNTDNIGDDPGETPGSFGTVDLGAGRTAVALSAGDEHTCAILDTGQVRCWGDGSHGKLGYGGVANIGDGETPGSVGPIDLGTGRTAVAISGGDDHTCAILDTGQVLCWGWGAQGRLGYGNQDEIGNDPGETPGSVGPVDLGAGRTAMAISAGYQHTCVILDTGQVRCWGEGDFGRLGQGSTQDIGDTETPGSVGPVFLGTGRTAVAISAGFEHTCAILDTGQVRCWGEGNAGRLGYGNTDDIGNDPGETPGGYGPVDLGVGRTAVAISAGGLHTCAVLDTGQVRCWGYGDEGRLGHVAFNNIGDDESPSFIPPIDLGGLIATTITPGLSLKARPKRDGNEPFRFRARGELSGLFIMDDAVCSGEVVVRTKPRITRKKTTELEFTNGECSLRTKVKGTEEGRARLIASFEGNGSLDPDKAKKKVRAG